MFRAKYIGLFGLFATSALLAQPPADPLAQQPGLRVKEFIYDKAPFLQCHAATLAETKGGLIAAWFGGQREGHNSVGIWSARHDGKTWSKPVELANGVQDEKTRYPCWNPILFQPKGGPLLLLYKVGPSPSKWWGMVITSEDGGQTWTKPRKLPEGFLGPTKSPPIQLADGSLLCPSSSEHQGWRVHFERTDPKAEKWEMVGPINDGKDFGAIQPAIFVHSDGKLQALNRTRQKVVAETWSSDQGKTWTKLAASSLPNNNSGLTGLTLKDGRHLLVYNHTTAGRSPLNVAISKDGKNWQAALILENQPGEYSYPWATQSADGLVHILYTWRRTHVRHVVVEPGKLRLREIVNGKWPASP